MKKQKYIAIYGYTHQISVPVFDEFDSPTQTIEDIRVNYLEARGDAEAIKIMKRRIGKDYRILGLAKIVSGSAGTLKDLISQSRYN
jgi:hypothetical protein